MRKLIVAMICVAWIGPASAFQPRTGNWWNPSEPGRDFSIDIQNGVLVLVVYGYQVSGQAQWYLSSGPMSDSGRSYTGSLDKYVNGQCISCSFSGAPTRVGDDGVISIDFSSETTATVTLPDGRTTEIQPFNFSGDPPQGLLGDWLFVYDNISTFAVRFKLTNIVGATSGGSGVAGGMIVGAPSHFMACELQTSNQLAGFVVCGEADTTGAVLNGYYFRFGVDQTYGGYQVQADGQAGHPMKGYKNKLELGVAGPVSRVLATTNIAPTPGNKSEPAASANYNTGSLNDAIRMRSQSIIEVFRRASNPQ